jgi:hypothetical protein
MRVYTPLEKQALAALKELRSAAIMFRDAAYRQCPTLKVSNETVNMLSANLLVAHKAIEALEHGEDHEDMLSKDVVLGMLADLDKAGF